MQTQFETAKVNIYVFDTGDVLVTSNDDDTITVIWLDPTSVNDFNAYTDDDINLQTTWSKYGMWSPYDGTLFPPGYNFEYFASRGQLEQPSQGIYEVRKDSDEYREQYYQVLQWLNSHGTKPNNN